MDRRRKVDELRGGWSETARCRMVFYNQNESGQLSRIPKKTLDGHFITRTGGSSPIKQVAISTRILI